MGQAHLGLWLTTHNVARSGARASFPPKHGLTNTTEVTASNSTLCSMQWLLIQAHLFQMWGWSHNLPLPQTRPGPKSSPTNEPKILPTPAYAVKLAQYLEGYDSVLSHKIISGFMQGFGLDYTGERKSLLAPNLAYAREFPEVIDSKIQSEVAFGRIVGPFDTPPPPWTHCGCPLLEKSPKLFKGEHRMIQHLSYTEE